MSEVRAACFGLDPDQAGWPTVSVVVPVRNEAPYLERSVASIVEQVYPGELDVCLAVAPSTDGTEALADRLAAADDRVSVVANPAGVTPAGLNAAIAATTGAVVVRVDGHAALSDGYVRRAVETMCRTGAVNVGGMQVPAPETPFEAAVAAATTSWLGTGGASYRVGGTEGAVDTVYLGVFDRAAGDLVGWFDETLLRNQDYELNIRLRAAGGVVWFDPELSVRYRPRGTLRALGRQYFEYGRWKALVIRRQPGSLKPRQAAPALVPLAVVAATLASRRRSLAVVAALCHQAIALVVMWPRGPRRDIGARVAAISTIHLSWSLGFDWGVVSLLAPRRRLRGSPGPRR